MVNADSFVDCLAFVSRSVVLLYRNLGGLVAVVGRDTPSQHAVGTEPFEPILPLRMGDGCFAGKLTSVSAYITRRAK